MREEIIVRILWLSDIHFREEYDASHFARWAELLIKNKEQKNDAEFIEKFEKIRSLRESRLPDIENYINSFLAEVKTYIHSQQENEKKIDYVLLSGDLAYSGSEADYISFDKMIVGKLKTLLGSETRFLAVPGNHDVFRNKGSFLSDLWCILMNPSGQDTKKAVENLRRHFLLYKKEYFDMIFQHYQGYFEKSIGPTLPAPDTSKEYIKQGMYGYVVDRKRNLVINLFNSAWFALGTRFDDYLIKYFLDESKREILEYYLKGNFTDHERVDQLQKYIRRILEAKNLVLEYGEQLLGEDIMPKQMILDKIDSHSGFCVVSAFHHPPNWLQYSTKYGENNEDTKKLFFNEILERSQLLLTGHEHVPSYVSPEIIGKSTCHIKGGMFMQDDMLLAPEGQHRFSILEINTSEFRLEEHKYTYNFRQAIWECDKNSVQKHKLTRREHIFKLENQSALLAKFLNKDIILEIMREHFDPDGDIPTSTDLLENPGEHIKLLRYYKGDRIYKIVVLPLDNYFMDEVLGQQITTPNQPHPFDNILKRAGQTDLNNISITILCPDFLVTPDAKARLSRPDVGKTDGGHPEQDYLYAKADLIFNYSRHSFFNRFEDRAKSYNHLIVNDIEFINIKNTKFSIQVLPFWQLDKYG